MTAPPPQAPPLKAQIIALAIVVGLFGSGAWLYVDYELSIEEAFDHRDEERLGQLRSDGKRLRVVGIGTSLLRRATVRGDQLGGLGEGLESVVDYARLCRPAGGLLSWRPAMAQVAEAEPDVVVFESLYLFYRLKAGRLLRERYFRLCRSLFRQIVLPSEALQWPPAPRVFLDRWQQDRNKRRDFGPQRVALRQRFWSQVMASGLRPGAFDVMRELKARNVRVVVVEVPMKAETLATYPDDERASMGRELGRLHDSGLVSLYDCPLGFAERHFLDSAHLNPRGQRRFSRWLFSEIVAAQGRP